MRIYIIFSFSIIFLVTDFLYADNNASLKKYYHIMDLTCVSCPPSISLWDVSADLADSIGNYVVEYVDNEMKVRKLVFFYNNKNESRTIDEPEYVTYDYSDSSIIVTNLYSPAHWYESNYFEQVDRCLSAIQCVYYYKTYPHSQLNRITHYSVETIKGERYYVRQLMDCYNFDYKKSKTAVDSVMKCSYARMDELYEKHDYDCNDFSSTFANARINCYSYSYFKNGKWKSEPKSFVAREADTY